ncbi:dihydrolipoyl dehydrogenase family protein [Microbacterium sp. R86528]|uniref:dihydrolipoyl dehydrogenase family protein n=1 Tax=Microbacterium sp. R86528 TaxID=3093864 RepID=UPI0037C77C1A
MQKSGTWDLVVVGGGSAGLVASKTAAGFGAKVLLIERDRLGGDCLWMGCVPSKTLIAVAHDVDAARRAGRSGPLDPELAQSDFERAMSSVTRASTTIAPVDSPEALEAENVSVMIGDARFTSAKTLDVNGQQVTFRQAVVATGSSPVLPNIEGAETVQMRTSEDFWDLAALPPRLVVLGGGAIGSELGQAMARLGSQVTIVHRGSRLLPKEDEEASEIVHRAMTDDGVTVLTGRSAVAVRSTDGQSGVVTLDDGAEVAFDAIVAALGRTPQADSLGLELAGVDRDAKGYVEVDDSLRTTNPRIWSAGDITGLAQFTHTAGVNGSVAATNAILGLRRKAETRVVPRVTFTAPEVAAVGLQSADATAGRHRVVTWHHEHSDRAIAENNTAGFARIVVDRRGKILGGTIVGPRAGETMGELALAMKANLSTSVLAGVIHPYPTFNDPLWNTAVADVRYRLRRGAFAVAVQALRRLRALRVR